MRYVPRLRYFEKGDRVYVQAQQVWLVLGCAVMTSERKPRRPYKLSYGDLAKRMGLPARAGITLSRPLGIIGHYCVMTGLPAINCIVVNDLTDQPGDHVVTRPGKTYQQEQADVMEENWHRIRVPTTGTFRKVWEQISGQTESDDDNELA